MRRLMRAMLFAALAAVTAGTSRLTVAHTLKSME